MLINKLKLKRFLGAPNKKSFLQIIIEAIIAGKIEKVLPQYYFSKCLYRKSIKNYKDYIASFRGLRIGNITIENNNCLASILDNKLFFNEYLKETKLKYHK